MTYSRPATSTVNALFLPATPQDAKGVQRLQVDVGQNGRLLDFSNPAQAGANAGRDLQEVSSFLENATKVAAPIYKQYLEGQGQQQATKFLSTVDVATLYRNGSEEQRDMLSSLNPFAQTFVADAAARSAARSYQEYITAQASISPMLANQNATAEQVAAERSRIRGLARQWSGIDNIPAGSMAPYVGSVAEVDSAAFLGTYKTRLAGKRDDLKTGMGKALGLELRQLNEARTTLLDAKDDGSLTNEQLAGYKSRREAAMASLRSKFKEVTEGGMATPNEFVQELINGAVSTYRDMLAGDDLQGASTFLSTLTLLTTNDFPTAGPGSLSLWDLRTGENGATFKDTINELSAKLQPEYERWRKEKLMERFGATIVGMNSNDPAVREAARLKFDSQLPALAQYPELLTQAVGAAGQMQGYAENKPNPARDAEVLRFTQELGNPNRDRNTFYRAVAASTLLTPKQKLDLIRNNSQPDNPVLSLVNQGADAVKDEVIQSGLAITRAQLGSGRVSGADAEELARRNTRDLMISARKAAEVRIQKLVNSGEAVTPIRAAEVFRNEVEAITKTRLKEAGQPGATYKSFNTTVMEEIGVVQERINKVGGGGTVGIFPPAMRERARALGINTGDYKSMQRYFLGLIGQVKDAQGKPMFPDPQKAYRQMVEEGQRVKGKGGQGGPAGPQSAVPFAPAPLLGPAGTALGPLAPIARPLAEWVWGKATQQPGPQSSNTGGSKPAGPVKPQPQPLEVVAHAVGSGLGALVGALATPAMAAEPTPGKAPKGKAGKPGAGGLVNAEGMDDMAALWGAGSRGIQAATRPLPQVAAATPVATVPMAINNVNHPFFIAIGIAEGTRTAAGGFTRAYYGHTDPGNGARNVGTISSQDGGTPQVADQRGMARLTQQQVAVAAVLRQLGVPAGTAGYNRLMFNALDLTVQAPLAATDFIKKLPQVLRAGATIEAIAKARADSFINPATGRLEASGFGNSYSRLLADQRSRAGAFDYKRRL